MVTVSDINNPRVVECLQSGGLVVMPTDTVFGVVASAVSQSAVGRLYTLKARDNKPGTIIAASVDQLVTLGLDCDDIAKVEHLWPGAVSVVLPAPKELAYLHVSKESLAVRIPDDINLRDMLQKTGALLTSSANQPGHLPAENVNEAVAYFGDKVDIYVEGSTKNKHASTVCRLAANGELEILRQGTYDIKQV